MLHLTHFCELEDCLALATLLLLTEMILDGSSDTSDISVVVDSILVKVAVLPSGVSPLASINQINEIRTVEKSAWISVLYV